MPAECGLGFPAMPCCMLHTCRNRMLQMHATLFCYSTLEVKPYNSEMGTHYDTHAVASCMCLPRVHAAELHASTVVTNCACCSREAKGTTLSHAQFTFDNSADLTLAHTSCLQNAVWASLQCRVACCIHVEIACSKCMPHFFVIPLWK